MQMCPSVNCAYVILPEQRQVQQSLGSPKPCLTETNKQTGRGLTSLQVAKRDLFTLGKLSSDNYTEAKSF